MEFIIIDGATEQCFNYWFCLYLLLLQHTREHINTHKCQCVRLLGSKCGRKHGFRKNKSALQIFNEDVNCFQKLRWAVNPSIGDLNHCVVTNKCSQASCSASYFGTLLV